MYKRYYNYISGLMDCLDFPFDAKVTFQGALLKIFENESEAKNFTDILSLYDADMSCDYQQMLSSVKMIGKFLGIHEFTISLLMYLCMAETLQKRYRDSKISEDIFYHSMMDLRYKLEECRLVHGVTGTFVAHWFYRFFNLSRFALGRLQFELIETKEEYAISGLTIPSESKVINVHIPRSGTKLDHEEVLNAYKLAAEMFSNAFENGTIVFTCYSWLLDPWNLTVLSKESNLARFCDDFAIVETGNYDGYGELWRLFDCMYTGDPAKLPQDTSLRRAYAKRVACGDPIGWGRGFFVYRNGEIVR